MSGGLRKRGGKDRSDEEASTSGQQQQVIDRICGLKMDDTHGWLYQVRYVGVDKSKWISETDAATHMDKIKTFYDSIPKEEIQQIQPADPDVEEIPAEEVPASSANEAKTEEPKDEKKKGSRSVTKSRKHKARRLSVNLSKIKKSVKRGPARKAKIGAKKVAKRRGMKPVK